MKSTSQFFPELPHTSYVAPNLGAEPSVEITYLNTMNTIQFSNMLFNGLHTRIACHPLHKDDN